ncbi:MAG: L-threonine 3-dehydrogenase [Fimbriimonadaceae bacterium]|nr:L-threonine 3-dehydrogenase [Chthonomonadaceae bacterium]MCO5295549.1 L-threonine 3-dehydrogenase [Fimbriimonadaceae bacterium]
MRAIAKTRPAPGVEIIDVPEPQVSPGTVKVRLEAASVCGTDLHIYAWDAWSASRIHPPRIIGHEFCGTIVEVGEGVKDRHVGDFVASESHIVCGRCKQCLSGQGHVCVNTRILGVDVDGGFAEFVVIPTENARPTDRSVPKEIACFQDALGNAVHTVMAGPIVGQTVLITGMGPIGLFAASICKALGAAQVIGTEVSHYRIDLAKKVGVDQVLNPKESDVSVVLRQLAPEGVDATLEMSGHPSALELAIAHTRPGGRVSLLGVYGSPIQSVDMNAVVFKGLDVQGIVGRRMWETWEQMGRLLAGGRLDLWPVITHQMHYTEFKCAMDLMQAGDAGKVVFLFD